MKATDDFKCLRCRTLRNHILFWVGLRVAIVVVIIIMGVTGLGGWLYGGMFDWAGLVFLSVLGVSVYISHVVQMRVLRTVHLAENTAP